MFKIKTMNKISPKGLAELPTDSYIVGDDVMNEDGILVRSAKLTILPSRNNIRQIPGQGPARITLQLNPSTRRGNSAQRACCWWDILGSWGSWPQGL